MKPVPMLATIRVATPCRADWNEMTGDARMRHCTQCDKDVFNLSDMTREQAEALIIAKNGDLCARYYQRHDGTILLADCSIGLAQKRKTRVLAAGAAALLAGSGGGFIALRTKAHAPVPPAQVVVPEAHVTGVLVADPPPPPPPPPEDATAILGGMPPPSEEYLNRERLEEAKAELKAKQAELAKSRHAKRVSR